MGLYLITDAELGERAIPTLIVFPVAFVRERGKPSFLEDQAMEVLKL